MDFYKVPLGFGMALARNFPALNAYSAMTDEQKKLLDAYVDKHSTVSCHLEYSAFLVGYKTATRLLSEAIFGKEHE